MTIKPLNKQEQFSFALEDLRAEIQYDILRCLKTSGISQAELAKRIGVSAPWVSQILGDDANLTLESIVKVFLGFDRQCKIISAPLHDELSCATMPAELVSPRKPNTTSWLEAGWCEVKAPASYTSPNDTVSELMKIIESKSSHRDNMIRANDNFYVQQHERTREFA